jgi:tRNA-specific 2-thiouridylase
MTAKALSLMSGGLDSVLATKLVLDQGIEVVGLHFVSLLCNSIAADRGGLAEKTARDLGIRFIIQDKGPEFLEVVKKPVHGYGKNMNPCIDCKVFMLRAASEIMTLEGAAFVITGEVVGQRPMSQMRRTIMMIEKESGLSGRILRPLSAKLLPASKPEQDGMVDREKLLAISGRSRKEQYRLAEMYDIHGFGAPAGGCLLTDPVYSQKLAELLARDEPLSMKDVALLRIGRHFRINGVKLVLGRNRAENEWLASFWGPTYTLVYPVFFKGPTGIFKGPVDEDSMKKIISIVAFYSKNSSPTVTLELFDGTFRRQTAQRTDIDLTKYRIERDHEAA